MVTVKALTVHWHQDSSPIYSVCFQPGTSTWPNRTNRLVTGGGDNNVRVWRLKLGADLHETPQVEYLATLANHTSAVNCVAFDPFGNVLATAGDDGVVRLWALTPTSVSSNIQEFDDAENWKLLRLCRCASVDEIYDLAWSPNGRYVAATSMDRVVSIIDASTGACVTSLKDHKHYVQGVSWDPKGEFIATQSSDQRLLIYSVTETNASLQVRGPIMRFEKNPQISFHPESFSSFFRRLSFSPDGLLLIVPAARSHTSEEMQECALMFTRGNLQTPVACIPLPKPSLAVRFCPILFERSKPDPLVDLPYKMVYAIATLTSIFLYDTESATPLGMASNLHYSSITDIAWSPDGRILVLTSIDGFCSTFRFEKNELGIPIQNQPEPPAPAPITTEEQKQPAVVNTLNVRRKAKAT